MTAEEARAAGDHDTLLRQVGHECLLSAATAACSGPGPPLNRDSTACKSASTMVRTRPSKVMDGSQPRTLRALEASAQRESTSAGRKYRGSIFTCSLQSRLACENASSTNSPTVWASP